MPPAAQPADPPELATLEELGAFDRLRHRGVHLSDNARSLLAQVPPRLRLAAVELAASSGEASCPLCGLALRDDPLQRISHLWLHGGGDIDDDGGPRARATKAFSVSASMLGNYFDLRECNRWLHQRAQRGRREPDIESLVDPLRTAHAARGDDFEAQLCTSLRRDGLPAEWEGDAGTANGQRIRFVSVDEYNQLPDKRGFGKFIDLKEEAKRLCGCSSCSCRDEGLAQRSAASLVVAAEKGGACSLLTEHQNASNKALKHEGGVPTVLYQLMVLPPQNVSGDVALSHGYLDYVILLPTDDGAMVRCTVVDAKATDRVKVGAKVQVAYYSWVLEEIANSRVVRFGREQSRAPLLRMSEMGGVWLHGRDAPVPFKLTELKRMVRKSVRDTLPMVLVPSKEAHQQTWQLGPSCLGCDYLNDCKHDAQTKRHVGSLPGLSRRRQLELERAVPGLSEPNALHKLAEFAAQPQPEEHVRRLLSRLLLVSYDGYAPVRLPSVSVQLEERCGGVAVVSPRLAAVCGGEPYLNGTPSLTLPSSEAVALHVVLLEDPRVRRVYAWALRLRDGTQLDSDVCECIEDADDAAERHYAVQEYEFVRQLDRLLIRVNDTRRAVYIAERHEHATLMRTLMAGAMRLGSNSDAGEAAAAHPRRCLRCLFTLIALPDLVQLPQQPDLAVTRGGVVPDACVVLAEEVRRMMSLPTPGPWRFDDACANLLHDWRDSPAPPTAELTYAAWRYPRTMGAEAVKLLLRRRLDTGVTLLGTLRRLCAEHSRGTAALLPNMAPVASGEAAGLTMEPEMSKLCFIAELEAHTKHRAMVALRAAPLEHRLAQRRGKTFLLRLDAIVSGDPSSGGSVDIELSAVADVLDEVPVSVGGNEWLLCRNSGEGLVDVMRWGDLDDQRHLKPPRGKDMLRQHNLPPKGHVLLAEVHALHPADRRVTLRVQCCAAGSGEVVKLTEVELTQGAEYVLQPRYVDFTTSKVVRRLQDDSRLVRESRDPLSAMLLRFTRRIGSMQPTPPAPALTTDVETTFPMTESQRAIYNHMCSSVLTLTQGPPGSGKTHFLAAAIGRLLIASCLADEPMRVLVTAVTHDALNHLLSKLARMLAASALLDDDTTRVFKLHHSSGPIEVDCNVRVKRGRPRARARQVFRVMALEVGRVQVQACDGEELEFTEADLVRVNDYGHLSPTSKLTQLKGKQVVLGATVFQMGRIRDKLVDEMVDADAGYFDLLVVDEASQMQLSHVLLPLHLLRARPPDDAVDDTGGGRLVVVGDTRQMGPILQNEYPDDTQLCEGSPPPHWSLLRWLWERTSSDASHLHGELQENHRMTPHLARFTEHVLGYEGFQACGKCGCTCHADYEGNAVPLLELSQPDACVRSSTVEEALQGTSAFVLIEVKAPPEPTAAIEEEAVLVVELVQSYLARRGRGDDDGVFIVTPHHTQRLAVSRRLEQHGVRKGQVCVDTVERMQGQERDLVIVCYGSLIDLDEPGELDFTYSRERLNTAVTRAKKKCVLICASDLLDPSVAACETMERQAGYELLRRIAAQCPDHIEDGRVRVRYDASAAAAHTQTMGDSAASADQAITHPSQLSAMIASQADDDGGGDDDDDDGGGAGG